MKLQNGLQIKPGRTPASVDQLLAEKE